MKLQGKEIEFLMNLLDTTDYNTAWKVLVQFLSHTGLYRYVLTDSAYIRVRMLADGFGTGISPTTKEHTFWDWSHVRDSSEEAVFKMASKLFEELSRMMVSHNWSNACTHGPALAL